MAKFTTETGGPSFCEIWAPTKRAAEKIAQARGMGPISPAPGPRKEFRPSVLASLPGGWSRPDVLHSLCYLSYIAARSKVAKAEELTGDGSPLHELAHYLGAGPNIMSGRMLPYLRERVAWLESIIPGMPPADWKCLLPDSSPEYGVAIERNAA